MTNSTNFELALLWRYMVQQYDLWGNRIGREIVQDKLDALPNYVVNSAVEYLDDNHVPHDIKVKADEIAREIQRFLNNL